MSDVPLTWKSGLALLALNMLDREAVEAVATAGLEQGLDSPSLRQLAGGSTGHGADPRVTLTSTLTALGVALPSRPEAARALAIELSRGIVEGSVDPVRASWQLAEASRAVGAGFHELDPFIYAESEAQSRPAERELFVKAIMDEARRWRETGKGSI
jgi:hypothetical protein